MRPGRLELHLKLTFPTVSEQETLVRHFVSCLLRGMHANLNPSSSSTVAVDSQKEQETSEQQHTSKDEEVVNIIALASQVLQEVEAEMIDMLRKQNTFQPSIW